MGLIDKSNVKARTRVKKLRIDPWTLEEARAYLKNDHALETKRLQNESVMLLADRTPGAKAGSKVKRQYEPMDHPWVKEDDEGVFVEINLDSMNIYWTYEDAKDDDGNQIIVELKAPGDCPKGENPADHLTKTADIQAKQGASKYYVKDAQAAWDFIGSLIAAGDADAEWNEILDRAAIALKGVKTTELPNINTYAEQYYYFKKHDAKFGDWNHKDGSGARGPIISKEKTNVINACKQVARNSLGYQRLADTLVKRV